MVVENPDCPHDMMIPLFSSYRLSGHIGGILIMMGVGCCLAREELLERFLDVAVYIGFSEV